MTDAPQVSKLSCQSLWYKHYTHEDNHEEEPHHCTMAWPCRKLPLSTISSPLVNSRPQCKYSFDIVGTEEENKRGEVKENADRMPIKHSLW